MHSITHNFVQGTATVKCIMTTSFCLLVPLIAKSGERDTLPLYKSITASLVCFNCQGLG